MSVDNTYAIHFSAAQIAKADHHHLLNWQQRWPNFGINEVACRHCGDAWINYRAMDNLQHLRTLWRRPMIIGSGYRCPIHNQKVGGAPKSKHLTGQAFDVRMQGYSDAAVVSFIYHAVKAEFTGFGLYLDRTTPFLHIDTGGHRTWQSGQSRLDDTDDITELTPAF